MGEVLGGSRGPVELGAWGAAPAAAAAKTQKQDRDADGSQVKPGLWGKVAVKMKCTQTKTTVFFSCNMSVLNTTCLFDHNFL